jgi:4-amino-4-deoxy-L-arabinose transferase-like glycosyltransferase
LNIRSNGHPALEHPPLLVWTEAVLYSIFGFHDVLAKLPAAVTGWGTILLVYWLARRLLNDAFQATLAMFVMATSIYFLKYSARAMTDVPCTFFFIASVCAWTLTDEDPRWYLITGVLAAFAQMSRGMMGFALPVIFALHLYVRRRRPPVGYAIAAVVITFAPLAAWYAHMIAANPDIFLDAHSTWLRNEVYGSLQPPWRRYTGAPEYLWMITKSYWPWLPAMIAGLLLVIRNRGRKLAILPIWIAVVFFLCAITRSRVLRYMLPAYPAFSVLAAIGMARYIPERYLYNALRLLTPILAIAVLSIAVYPPIIWHAKEIRPIAAAETGATEPGQRVAFYDEGNPRFDEANQLQWYGSRNLILLFTPEQLQEELQHPRSDVFVVDRNAFHTYIGGHMKYRMIAESGNLICFRLGAS